MNMTGAMSFAPSPSYLKALFIYLLLSFLVGIAWWYIPLLLFAPWYAALGTSVFIIPLLVLVLIWIPLYFRSISYRLDPEELEWKRGVWFRTTGVVPYNRITNIDIKQGPISRALGIASLSVQTAGYSAQNVASEIRIDGLVDPEGMRDRVLSYIRTRKPVATESEYEPSLMGEVRSIRETLESISERLR
jgi:membrane protein YdbS with pleckstrin-like domain